MNISLSMGDFILHIEGMPKDNNYITYPWKLDAFKTRNYIIEDKECFLFKYEYKDYNLNDYIEVFIRYDGFCEYSLFENSQNYLWVKKDCEKKIILVFEISKDWKKCLVVADYTKTNGRYAFEYYARFFQNAVLKFYSIVFHGVLLEYDNKGIIITASSGTGKTTHARMWRDYERAIIINGDCSLCQKSNGKWMGYGIPWCGTSGEYINRSISIDAIAVIEQNKENVINRINKLEAFLYLYSNAFLPMWEKSLVEKGMDCIQDMIQEIPVFQLKCKPDYEAVKLLKNEIDKL